MQGGLKNNFKDWKIWPCISSGIEQIKNLPSLQFTEGLLVSFAFQLKPDISFFNVELWVAFQVLWLNFSLEVLLNKSDWLTDLVDGDRYPRGIPKNILLCEILGHTHIFWLAIIKTWWRLIEYLKIPIKYKNDKILNKVNAQFYISIQVKRILLSKNMRMSVIRIVFYCNFTQLIQ